MRAKPGCSAVASCGCRPISCSSCLPFIPLWCFGGGLCRRLRCPRSAKDLGGCVECKKKLSSDFGLTFFTPFCSNRAKPASNSNSNSNDAGGVDESDLEKMKQVFYIRARPWPVHSNLFVQVFNTIKLSLTTLPSTVQ